MGDNIMTWPVLDRCSFYGDKSHGDDQGQIKLCGMTLTYDDIWINMELAEHHTA